MPAAGAAIGAAAAFIASPMGSAIILGGAAVLAGVLWGMGTPDTPSTTDARSGDNRPTIKIGESTPIDAIFGRQVTAGQYAGHQTYGNDNRFLKLVYILGSAQHESLEGLIVNDTYHSLSGSNSDSLGKVVSGYDIEPDNGGSDTEHMWVKFYSGTLSQVADPQMVARSDPDTRWTTDHRLAGHAYAIVTIRFNKNEDDLRSIPTFRFDVKGLRLYDPRKDSTQPGGSGSHTWGDTSTYEWTRNPAIMVYNYKRGIYLDDILILGDGCAEQDIDLDYIVAAANLSDENVTYIDTGVTVDRYTCGVVVDSTMASQDVCAIFETAMGGVGMQSGGKYAPIPAAARTSVMTITDDDLQPGYRRTARKKMSPIETYTAVHGTYCEPTKAWQATSYGIMKDAAVDAAQGGRRTLALDLNFIHQLETAQALAEIQRRRDLYTASEELVVRHKFVRLQPGDVIERQCDLFGEIDMMVESVEELEDGSISLKLREWNNLIVPTASGFMTIPDTDGVTVATPTRLDTVLGLLLTPVSITSGAATRAGIRVGWDPIADPTVSRVIIRYWVTALGEAEAQNLPVETNLSQASTLLTGLAPLTNYTVKATIATDPPRATVWTAEETTTTFAESNEFDGQIDIADLVDEFAQEVASITHYSGASVLERIEDLRNMVEDLAQATATQDGDTYFWQVAADVQFDGITDQFASVSLSLGALADEDEALASQILILTAEVDDNYTELSSSITSEATARATGDSTNATNITNLSSTVTNNYNTLNSAITTEATTRATADSTNASNITTVSSQVGDVSASGFAKFSTTATASGATASYVVGLRTSAYGTVYTGGLRLDLMPGNFVRAFLNVDQFIVGNASTATAPFSVVSGTVRIDTAVIRDLTAANITAAKINAYDILVNGTGLTELLETNAVSVIYTGGGDSEQAANNSSTFATIAEVTDVVIPTNATGCLVMAFASGEYGNPSTAEFRIRRTGGGLGTVDIAEFDGTHLDGSGGADEIRDSTTYARRDAPGAAGTYTYSLQVRSRDGTTGYTDYVPTRWKYRRIVVVLMKR